MRIAFSILFVFGNIGCGGKQIQEAGYGDSICVKARCGEICAEEAEGFLCVDVAESDVPDRATLFYFDVEGVSPEVEPNFPVVESLGNNQFHQDWTFAGDTLIAMQLAPGGYYECNVPSRVICMEHAEYQQGQVSLSAMGGKIEVLQPLLILGNTTPYICAYQENP